MRPRGIGRDSGAMADDSKVTIHPPDERGRHLVTYRREELGRATSERDVREFLYRAGMADAEDVDLTDEALFDWQGTGPESWA
ncbi:hypothetical protein GCM10010347_43590 [Streptomyces cirratus]|uniref:Uncharacterized protein n=2 Tax=Streptomyces cirratus TaxID=68187 RepID=A0ABQ3F0Z7_9ACTN|nr:hypothetical protein GCM10010347_43590 [Streptomyces cirratus]